MAKIQITEMEFSIAEFISASGLQFFFRVHVMMLWKFPCLNLEFVSNFLKETFRKKISPQGRGCAMVYSIKNTKTGAI